MLILINAILCFFIPLCVLISIIGLWKNPSNWKRFLPLLLYAIFVISYTYQPLESSDVDLLRYFQDVKYCGKLTFMETVDYYRDGLFAENFLLWLFGHIGDVHLLPAFTTTCVYSIAFYITCDFAVKYKVKYSIGWILLFQFAMLPFVSIINNVRNVFSFSVIILAVYLDIVKQKKNIFVLFLYLIGCFMHLSAAFFLLLRISCRFVRKSLELVMILPFIMGSMIIMIYQNRAKFTLNLPMPFIRTSINNGIQLTIQKMYSYLMSETSEYGIIARTSRYFRTNRVIMMFGAILMVVLVFYIIRFNKEIFKEDFRILVFVFLIGVMTLSCNIFAIPNYWRFSAASYVISGVLVIPLIANYKNLSVLIRGILGSYFMLAVASLLLQWWWAHYSVNFIEWGNNIITTNIYTIIIKRIINIL